MVGLFPNSRRKSSQQGKQLRIPILVGSNADEATVFGHNDLKTVSDYGKHLQQDTGQYSKEEFQLYPVSSDADVPTRSAAPGERRICVRSIFDRASYDESARRVIPL